MTPQAERNSLDRALSRQDSSTNMRIVGSTMMALSPIIAGTGLGLITFAAGAAINLVGGWRTTEHDRQILNDAPEYRPLSLNNEDINAESRRTATWGLITSAVMGLAGAIPAVWVLARIPMAVVAWNGLRETFRLRQERREMEAAFRPAPAAARSTFAFAAA